LQAGETGPADGSGSGIQGIRQPGGGWKSNRRTGSSDIQATKRETVNFPEEDRKEAGRKMRKD